MGFLSIANALWKCCLRYNLKCALIISCFVWEVEREYYSHNVFICEWVIRNNSPWQVQGYNDKFSFFFFLFKGQETCEKTLNDSSIQGH